ncbi:MAG: hypothetical protein C0512_13665 [Flavobacterium sp.]|nr:hypothetical protein [Flavobacterium sp.]
MITAKAIQFIGIASLTSAFLVNNKQFAEPLADGEFEKGSHRFLIRTYTQKHLQFCWPAFEIETICGQDGCF